MFWDHDVKWCIYAVGDTELDFRFSIIQTPVGYCTFDEGVSKLKQVTGRDHRAVQHYIISVVARKIPHKFLIAVHALLDFRYLTQAPVFTTDSLDRVSAALQEFHDNKDAIISHGAWTNWEIPKLELLQSVVPSIHESGSTMQWSADITEHAHVQEIKLPARAGNNQNYYSQITHHLDRLEKCFRFDLATHIDRHVDQSLESEDELDGDNMHEPDAEDGSFAGYHTPTRSIINYFAISSALQQGRFPSAPRPFRTFATSATAFHLATKPSSQLAIDEAAVIHGLADLIPSISAFFARQDDNSLLSGDRRLQVWHKLCVQQTSYHSKETLEAPQTLRSIPPSTTNPYGIYDSVIIGPSPESNWPRSGLDGHSVAQLQLIFRVLGLNTYAAYVQCFAVVPQSGPNNTCTTTGMHVLKRATRANGERVGEVIPLTHIQSPAHLIPQFGREAHPRLTKSNCYKLNNDFWLNKYWSKESFYVLSSV